MTFVWRNRCAPWLLGATVLLLPAVVLGVQPRAKSPAPAAEAVEMFSAMEKGQIDVKFIPRDSTQARVLITNRTDKPLSIKLPEAFAGVPVLAQGAAAGGGGDTGGDQAMGGGMGGMMGGMGGMGGGGGFFNVAPEKVGQLKVATVCLEHGKREPRPNVPYAIKPIEAGTSKPEVQELCRMLGRGAIPQRAAQVAAWHLNNNMSWEQLVTKQYRYANGTTSPYFTQQEIQAGVQIVALAARAVQERQQQAPSASSSLNK